MGRKARIIGRATDHAGVEWDVRERRPTAHGFNLMLGWPRGDMRGRGGRGVATIVTAELARYLSETRLRDMDIPIGLTAIKRMRKEIGANWSWDAWWSDRKSDLLSMSLESFCSRHGCSIGAASQRRSSFRETTPPPPPCA